MLTILPTGMGAWSLPCSHGQCVSWSMQHRRNMLPHTYQPGYQKQHARTAQDCRWHMHAQQNDADQAFWDDAAPPSGRQPASRRGSTTAIGRDGRSTAYPPDLNSSAGPATGTDHQEAVDQEASSGDPPRNRNRSGSRQSMVSMDSMDYEGNDPWQQVPQHLAEDGGDSASDSLSEAHSWEADERFDSTPEAEWGRRSRWSAANQEQGFNDPFHNPKWDWNSPNSDGSDTAQQSGSSWDEGEELVVGSREPRTRSPSGWDWVSPAEARRRKQLQVRTSWGSNRCLLWDLVPNGRSLANQSC